MATTDQVVEIPWKTSSSCAEELISAGLHSIERQFAAKGTSAPIVLDRAQKKDLFGIVHVCMKVLGDEQARELLPLRNALLDDVEQLPLAGEPGGPTAESV